MIEHWEIFYILRSIGKVGSKMYLGSWRLSSSSRMSPLGLGSSPRLSLWHWVALFPYINPISLGYSPKLSPCKIGFFP